ncbi:hypothetical protein [Moraxella nasicaprae]|uniref:Uncharacterized protein n=1 Tax=Moraxella nasicaprae TaxID=2904122 RepID=A0ABY6F4S9_9GAMM|nr:hypothetical protein [Moraxella nasicaprae]UXZ05095.1 hypothetical protein LU297_01160 [Moraxella nasicaprae]
MFGIKILHSDDFVLYGGASTGRFFAMTDKETNKSQVYNLSTQVKKFELVDTDKVKTLANSVQNGALSMTVGAMLFGAGVFPALAALWFGSKLPNHTKDVYVTHIEFTDGKSAVVQLDKKKYQQFLKYIS